MRVGIGYDVHRLTEGRKLVLGGVKIPFDKGLLGHSDADVLVHAVCDALLGAAALGDIGTHFPDSDPQYKNINSISLLAKTWLMVMGERFEIENIDAPVFAEAPKLFFHKADMEANIARAVQLEPDRVNVKATTTEGLGMIGKGEGIAAMAIVLLKEASFTESAGDTKI